MANDAVACEPFACWRASASTRRMVGAASSSMIAAIMAVHMMKISAE
jgi:hypothetical protein